MGQLCCGTEFGEECERIYLNNDSFVSPNGCYQQYHQHSLLEDKYFDLIQKEIVSTNALEIIRLENSGLQQDMIAERKNNGVVWIKLNGILISEEIGLNILSYLTPEYLYVLSRVNSAFYFYWSNFSELLLNIQLQNYRFLNIHTICCKNVYNLKQFYEYISVNKHLNNCFKKVPRFDQTTSAFKISVSGDSGIGKSVWLTRLIDNYFSREYNPTVGAEFKIIYLKTMRENCKKEKIVRFWDLCGDDMYNSIISVNFYKGSSALMACFDLSNENSFDRVEMDIKRFVTVQFGNDNLEDLNSVLMKERKYVICIVGLRCESIVLNGNKRNVSLDKKIKLLLEIMLPNPVKYEDLFIQYFEISSRENINVNSPIYFAVSKLWQVSDAKVENYGTIPVPTSNM
ncbi:hypothetical protein ABK040_014919 [Willaertia magna]